MLDLSDLIQDPHQQEALQRVLRWLAAVTLTGAAARSGVGLYQTTIGRPPFFDRSDESTVSVRVPVSPESGKSKDPLALKEASIKKQAFWEWLRRLPHTIPAWINQNTPDFKSFWGNDVKDPQDIPWQYAGMIMGTPLALWLGYRLASVPVNRLVLARDRAERDRAREDYYSALAKSIAESRKESSDTASARLSPGLAELGRVFEQEYTRRAMRGGVQKSASDDDAGTLGLAVLKRLLFPLNYVAPPYGPAATLTIGSGMAGLGAYQAYQAMRSRSLPLLVAAEAERIRAEDEHEPKIRIVVDRKRPISS